MSVYKSHNNGSGSNHSGGDFDGALTFGSRIIEVSVFSERGIEILDFIDSNINLTFPVHGMNEYEPVCSFNSGKDSDWATEGCVVSDFNGYEDAYWNDDGEAIFNITCTCNHLTHFAVLLQLGDEGEETFDTYVLDILTKIGLGFSIVCLAVTLITYTMLRLMKSIRIVTHANLALALMSSDLIFFFIDTKNEVGCTLVAILLHFFLLAAFTWMALEGAFLYIKVTPTFRWSIRLPIWLLIGWGFPFGVVVVSAAVNFRGYVGNGRCWLSLDDGFVLAFLAPVISIIVVNTCILIRLIVIFFSLKANKDKSEAKKLKSGLRLAIVLEPLLGLPWVLGLFYTGKETVVFAYAFVIFNSLQGVFVFLGQCVFDQEVRTSLKCRSSRVESISVPQDSTSFTLASKQAVTDH
ncbi:adhesion G protein-coupled receptor L3-like [Asterias amurensis]|uniref:adhesion G protein-coupled receptor L3-like n=1 Tax=Asterias amurensis TaxID=7602 RepID=UPI003AB15AF5